VIAGGGPAPVAQGGASAERALAAHGSGRVLGGLELVTATAAVLGGALLVARPDGSLLHADQAVLRTGPFTYWRIPGLLLAGLVGGGWLAAGLWQWRSGRYASQLSMVAGLGLVLFETDELTWIGFQPLEAVFAGVGVLVFTFAARAW